MTGHKTLIKYAYHGRAGRRWYTHARLVLRHICRFHGWDYARYCDIVAIFSPRCSVTRNLRFATHYMLTGQCQYDVIKSTRAAIAHYESTGQIRGQKTSAFALALRGDDTSIVLDTWMFRAFDLPIKTERKAVLAECRKRIRKVARHLGVTPAEAQAMIWCGFYKLSYVNGNPPLFKPETVLPF